MTEALEHDARSEVVYSPDMPESNAVLAERLKTVIALGTGFAVIAAAVAVFFLSHIMDYSSRLAKIETSLEILVNKQTASVLQNPKGVATAELVQAARLVREKNIPVSPNAIEASAKELLDRSLTTNASEDWKGVSQLVGLRNVNISDDYPPSCVTAEATHFMAPDGPPGFVHLVGPIVRKECYFRIDDPSMPTALRVDPKRGFLCVDCVVEYGGGQIPVRVELYRPRFILKLDGAPTGNGSQLVRQIVNSPVNILIG